MLQRTGFLIEDEPSLTVQTTRENDIQSTLIGASKQGWQLAVVVLNSRNSDIVYKNVKSFANLQIGLMTQCVNYQALKRNIGKLDMCEWIDV